MLSSSNPRSVVPNEFIRKHVAEGRSVDKENTINSSSGTIKPVQVQSTALQRMRPLLVDNSKDDSDAGDMNTTIDAICSASHTGTMNEIKDQRDQKNKTSTAPKRQAVYVKISDLAKLNGVELRFNRYLHGKSYAPNFDSELYLEELDEVNDCPPDHGYNLCVLVGGMNFFAHRVRVDGRCIRWACVQVGDETGNVTLRISGEHVDTLGSCTGGAAVLRNCLVQIGRNDVSLKINRWGKLVKYPDHVASTPSPPMSFNQDYILSPSPLRYGGCGLDLPFQAVDQFRKEPGRRRAQYVKVKDLGVIFGVEPLCHGPGVAENHMDLYQEELDELYESPLVAGYNLCVLVGRVGKSFARIRADGTKVRCACMEVGDETGVAALIATGDQIDTIGNCRDHENGAFVLRNCMVNVRGNELSLTTNRWGKLTRYPDQVASTPCPPRILNRSYNLSCSVLDHIDSVSGSPSVPSSQRNVFNAGNPIKAMSSGSVSDAQLIEEDWVELTEIMDDKESTFPAIRKAGPNGNASRKTAPVEVTRIFANEISDQKDKETISSEYLPVFENEKANLLGMVRSAGDECCDMTGETSETAEVSVTNEEIPSLFENGVKFLKSGLCDDQSNIGFLSSDATETDSSASVEQISNVGIEVVHSDALPRTGGRICTRGIKSVATYVRIADLAALHNVAVSDQSPGAFQEHDSFIDDDLYREELEEIYESVPVAGYNLCVLVGTMTARLEKVRVDGTHVRVAHVEVGDETGIVALKAFGEQLDEIRSCSNNGDAMVLRNCMVNIREDDLSLFVNKWGKLFRYPDGIASTPPPPIFMNRACNFSLSVLKRVEAVAGSVSTLAAMIPVRDDRTKALSSSRPTRKNESHTVCPLHEKSPRNEVSERIRNVENHVGVPVANAQGNLYITKDNSNCFEHLTWQTLKVYLSEYQSSVLVTSSDSVESIVEKFNFLLGGYHLLVENNEKKIREKDDIMNCLTAQLEAKSDLIHKQKAEIDAFERMVFERKKQFSLLKKYRGHVFLEGAIIQDLRRVLDNQSATIEEKNNSIREKIDFLRGENEKMTQLDRGVSIVLHRKEKMTDVGCARRSELLSLKNDRRLALKNFLSAEWERVSAEKTWNSHLGESWHEFMRSYDGSYDAFDREHHNAANNTWSANALHMEMPHLFYPRKKVTVILIVMITFFAIIILFSNNYLVCGTGKMIIRFGIHRARR